MLGVNAPDGKGNITAYATYVQINAVPGANYDYTACSLNSGATFAAAGCGGSGTAFPARFGGFIVDPAGPGNTFRAAQRGDRRLQLRADQLPAAARPALRPGRLRPLRGRTRTSRPTPT